MISNLLKFISGLPIAPQIIIQEIGIRRNHSVTKLYYKIYSCLDKRDPKAHNRDKTKIRIYDPSKFLKREAIEDYRKRYLSKFNYWSIKAV
jgi:hypothetical protein